MVPTSEKLSRRWVEWNGCIAVVGLDVGGLDGWVAFNLGKEIARHVAELHNNSLEGATSSRTVVSSTTRDRSGDA